MEARPKFFTAFCRNVGETYERRGAMAIFPWWLAICLGLGTLAAWHVPAVFWAREYWGVATTVFTGFLAFNGLLLALGWGAFSRIYEILSTGWFSAFLRRNDLLSDHLFFVDVVHGILIVSAVSSGAGLVTVLLDLPALVDRMIFAAVTGLSLWSLVKALSAMRMMNDLVWELAHCEPDGRGHIRPVEARGP